MEAKYDLYSLLVEKSIRCYGAISEAEDTNDALSEAMSKVCNFLEQINQQRLNTAATVDKELEDAINN